MAYRRRKVVAVVLFAGAALGLAGFGLLRGGRYEQRGAGPASEQARAALEVIHALAREPESVADHLHPTATRLAQGAVEKAAELLHKAESYRLKDAEWFGEYLRVGVLCVLKDGREMERYFLFREEGGQLLVTGLQQ